jgi:diguanylate cyclase (GGDEF)-like protein
LLILPDTPLAGAFQVASWLREQIAARPVPWRDTQVTVTASFGVADALPGELSPTALIARADAALHEAKCAGRNCVQPAAHPDSAGTAV